MGRRRAVNVCLACHERKVRCDLSASTRPCSNCLERELECSLRIRKPYSLTNRVKRNTKAQAVGENEWEDDDAPESCTVDAFSPISQAYRAKLAASIIPQPSSRTTSIYVGESGYGEIWDLLRPGSPKRRHFTINGAADAALDAEDLEYLKLKGCFELPAQSDDLLEAYFRFVHPIFPVLDGRSFLQAHEQGGLNRMNLLLLWCIFSVSSSYVSACCVKETRALFVMRGKLLFNLSGENDKIVLIQSALLLSFWFDDPEDIKQSWYWSGIAFSLAQTLGLQRKLSHEAKEALGIKYSIWRNLWHCCTFRDTWLSYTMGRSLRLAPMTDSSPLPTVECRFEDMKLFGTHMYSEDEAKGLESMWRSSVTVANTLRQSLSAVSSQLSDLSMQLKSILQFQQEANSSLLLLLGWLHLRLGLNAAMIAICQRSGEEGLIETAADETVEIVQSYLSHTTVAYVPPTVVPLVLPAMLVYASALKSADPLKQGLGQRRLASCLQLLSMIEKTYPAASIVKHMFLAIYETLHDQDIGRP